MAVNGDPMDHVPYGMANFRTWHQAPTRRGAIVVRSSLGLIGQADSESLMTFGNRGRRAAFNVKLKVHPP